MTDPDSQIHSAASESIKTDKRALLESPRLEKLDRFSSIFDDRFRIPGTSIRFGFDSLLGLLPGIGDTAATFSHVYLVYHAHKLGIRKRVYVKMAGNAFVDFLFGMIPIVGDVFDLYWKSNRRNTALIRSEIERHQSLQDVQRQGLQQEKT